MLLLTLHQTDVLLHKRGGVGRRHDHLEDHLGPGHSQVGQVQEYGLQAVGVQQELLLLQTENFWGRNFTKVVLS